MTALSSEDTAALHAQATAATGPIPINPSVLLALLRAEAKAEDFEGRYETSHANYMWALTVIDRAEADLADLHTRIEAVLDGRHRLPFCDIDGDLLVDLIARIRAVLDPEARP